MLLAFKVIPTLLQSKQQANKHENETKNVFLSEVNTTAKLLIINKKYLFLVNPVFKRMKDEIPNSALR